MIQSTDTINLDNFDVQNKIEHNQFLHYQFYKILNCDTQQSHFVRSFRYKIESITKIQLLRFAREIDVLSKLNHPCIFRYTGYNITNFKKKEKPLLVTEYYSSHKIYDIISSSKEQNENRFSKWNDTLKLINIYGIASAMSYLHSHNILHLGINIANIYLDNNLYPKLFGFNASIELSKNDNRDQRIYSTETIGSLRYLSPETFSNFEYSKSSDVYAFAIVIYEILHNEIPYQQFKNKSDYIRFLITDGQRLPINDSIPQCYQDLIRRCWSKNPEERLTFDDIVNELKTNSDFITSTINEEQFRDYIKYLDESLISFSDSATCSIQN